MSFIFWFEGMIFGVIWTRIIWMIFDHIRHKIAGFIEVDGKTGYAKVTTTSTQLNDKRVKTATFKVIHDVDLSREIQGL